MTYLTLISPVVRHPKIIAKTQISRPRPLCDPGRGPVMPTGGAHRVIVSASGDSRAAGRTGHGRRRERPERVTTIVVYMGVNALPFDHDTTTLLPRPR